MKKILVSLFLVLVVLVGYNIFEKEREIVSELHKPLGDVFDNDTLPSALDSDIVNREFIGNADNIIIVNTGLVSSGYTKRPIKKIGFIANSALSPESQSVQKRQDTMNITTNISPHPSMLMGKPEAIDYDDITQLELKTKKNINGNEP